MIANRYVNCGKTPAQERRARRVAHCWSPKVFQKESAVPFKRPCMRSKGVGGAGSSWNSRPADVRGSLHDSWILEKVSVPWGWRLQP